jgi:hypothetical protein
MGDSNSIRVVSCGRVFQNGKRFLGKASKKRTYNLPLILQMFSSLEKRQDYTVNIYIFQCWGLNPRP